MKDIIRNVVLGVLAAVIVIAVAVFALKGDEPEVTTTTTAGTSDFADSSAGTAAQNPQSTQPGTTQTQGVTGSQGGNELQPDQPGQPQQSTAAPVINPAEPSTQAPAQPGSTQSQAPQSTQPGQQAPTAPPTTSAIIVNPQQPNQPQQVNKIDAYQEIFKSGKFYMKINDPELGLATMAMSGNKMFVETSIEGITMKMLYDGDKPDENNPQNGTWYMVVDKIKKYSPLPGDMVGDMNVEELTKNFTGGGNSNIMYTKSTEVIDGVTYDCESCVDSNGNTTKYYFVGDRLVRSDTISPSGAVSTTEFQEITGDFDESVFTIPAGYAKWDISWLIKMMG